MAVAKPTGIPRWADSGAITEPPEAKKDEGWIFEEAPPSQFENWKANLTGNWIKWLNERLGDGSSENEFDILDPVTGTALLRTVGENELDLFPDGIPIKFKSPISPATKTQFIIGASKIEYDSSNQNLRFGQLDDSDYIEVRSDQALFWVKGVEAASVLYDGTTRTFRLGTASQYLKFTVDSSKGEIHFDSLDHISFYRSLNRYDFYIANVGRLFIETDKVRTGTKFIAPKVIGTMDLQTPSTNEELVSRHARNAVVARGSFNDNGIGSNLVLLGAHFNFNGSAIAQGGGGWYLTFDVAVDQASSVLINLKNTITNTPLIFTYKWISSTVIHIFAFTTSGTLTNIPNYSSIDVTVIGSPATLP